MTRTFHGVLSLAALAAAAAVEGGVARAQGAQPLVIETVAVGNPGNIGDPIQFQGTFGAVDYVFAIAKYEVTAGQYTAFLNAVAATDPYGLYNVNMGTHETGCRIERTGAPGSYAYHVAPDWADRPVNYVSWGDAVRFVNWLHNGQPQGAAGLATTEDGAYFLDGKVMDHELENVVREPDAEWVIPTENEWYKAAYHKNDGLAANYWNYPTRATNRISNQLVDPDPGNNATFSTIFGVFTIGPPYHRTEVGAHENSESAYGSFDQGGNVQEFNETVPENDIRGIRGGSWYTGDASLSRWERPVDMHSSDEFRDLGFRVASRTRAEVPDLRMVGGASTHAEWSSISVAGGVAYDLARGDVAHLAAQAGGVGLGALACIEENSPDATSVTTPDTRLPPPGRAFFYVVRYQHGADAGPWGFGSAGGRRTGTGGCAP